MSSDSAARGLLHSEGKYAIMFSISEKGIKRDAEEDLRLEWREAIPATYADWVCRKRF